MRLILGPKKCSSCMLTVFIRAHAHLADICVINAIWALVWFGGLLLMPLRIISIVIYSPLHVESSDTVCTDLLCILSCTATPTYHHGRSCLRLRVYVCCSTCKLLCVWVCDVWPVMLRPLLKILPAPIWSLCTTCSHTLSKTSLAFTTPPADFSLHRFFFTYSIFPFVHLFFYIACLFLHIFLPPFPIYSSKKEHLWLWRPSPCLPPSAFTLPSLLPVRIYLLQCAVSGWLCICSVMLSHSPATFQSFSPLTHTVMHVLTHSYTHVLWSLACPVLLTSTDL